MEIWNNLDQKKKNILLYGVMFLVVYIAYNFSFGQTLKVIKLNRELKREENETQNLDGSFNQVIGKNNFYLNALRSYRVKAEDRENKLWQSVSGVAIAKQVEISFNPGPQLLAADTSAVQKQIYMQQFNFKGNYFNCIKLLDSLNKTDGIGVISSLKLFVQKEMQTNENASQVSLQLSLAATGS